MPLAPFSPFKPSKENPDQALIAFLNDHIRKLNQLLDTYGLDGTNITVPGGGVVLNGITASTGCIPSNGTDATNDINFSTGVQRDSSNLYSINAGSAFTKRADATWAAGTGNGGMASGLTFSATTDYHLHLLGQSTDPEAFDYVFDTSVTCANGLADAAVIAAGFDIYKRVSSIRSIAGPAWQLFNAREIAIGQVEYLLSAPEFELVKLWSGGADNTAQTGTLALPPGGIQVLALLGVVFTDATASAASALLISAIDQTDTAPSVNSNSWVGQLRISAIGGINGVASGEIRIRTTTTRTFRYRATGSTVDHTFGVCSLGWVDSRL